MKKTIGALALACAMALCSGACAQEPLTLEGTVTAGRTLTLCAPYSGVVEDFTAEPGDCIAGGEAVFAIRTQKVYADFDGTVSGVFAAAGDSAASVQERCGALAYLEREEPYSAACSINGAYSDEENKIVHPGEVVYVCSAASDDREGVGYVTAVNGKEYTVIITLSDELRRDEQIRVYRDADHDNDSCIGTGRLSRIDPVAVTTEGYVLAAHVKDGDSVARGALLFEIVPDMPQAGAAILPQDGVLLSVLCESGAQIAKDAPMAAYCPAGEMKLVCYADEDELPLIKTGARVAVVLDAYPQDTIEGTVEKISGVMDEAEGGYAVTIALEDNDFARIGMSAEAAM